jgi:hypothetical protein
MVPIASFQINKRYLSNSSSIRLSKALSSRKSLSGFLLSGVSRLVLFCFVAYTSNLFFWVLAKSFTLSFAIMDFSFLSALVVSSGIRSAISIAQVIAIVLIFPK